MAWANELPVELLCRPTGLVALSGLDVKNNAVHLSIWDAFCNNRRADRVPLQFKVFPAEHEYPKAKAKRTSYEWYIPKGILKTSWINKVLTAIPAVQVIFFDLDWDEPMWKEKQMQCATRVEIVRNGLQHRGTKVVVVLIQKNAPLPPGEDVMAAERAASLCSACDLSAKALYVLPHTDHLIGYIIRLENAFYDAAQSYYHSEARKVKAHKDFLNKTTHQLLFVRHQFKIGFYNELKQDSHTALKHYKQAYGHILELRMHDTNILEVKTNAGFINYKICRLSFQHNAPLDSIAQFRKHIDFFKSKTGISDVAFEHSAWMSKQFQLFGDLFDEAIKRGLTAIQTQHPGFYYQQAANHAIARKQLCRGLCKVSSSFVRDDIIEEMKQLEFYGQRSWRQGHQSIDPPDQTKEKDGISCLQNLELQQNHSLIIIPLLSSAVAQFKKYKSPRMKRYLMVQMGEEYFDSKDYSKALMLLSKVLWDYRAERWWLLLTCILETSLKCAYITAKVQEYMTNCLELVGNYTKCSIEEKTRIQMNLIRVLSNDLPEPEPALDQNSLEKAKVNWLEASREPKVITIEMHNIVSFVDCKCYFTSNKFHADSEIQVEVYLRVSCPFPMRFTKLSVTFNNQDYNRFCEVMDGHGVSADSLTEPCTGDLYLVPDHIKMQKFTFLASKDDVDHEIEIKSVALEIGSVSGHSTILHWNGCGGDSIGTPQLVPTELNRVNTKTDEVIWEQIPKHSTAKILPRQSNVKILMEHQAPALVNEFYRVSSTITNNENTAISDVCLSFELQEFTDAASGEQTTHISIDKAEIEGKIVSGVKDLSIGTLQCQEKVKRNFYIKFFSIGTRNLLLKISYNVEIEKGVNRIVCFCKQQEMMTLSAVAPLEVSFKLESLKFEAIEVVHPDEPFLLLPEIRCIAPWPVEISTSTLQLSPYVSSSEEEIVSQVEDIHLKKNECASECICLTSQLCIQPSVSLGSYIVHWKRQSTSGDEIPHVSTVFPLPTVNIEQIPVSVHLNLPAMGNVKKLLPLMYVIKNKTGYTQEIEATMDSSDSFMFSGNKQVHLRVLPSRDYHLTYNLFPLVAGHMILPRLHINMARYPGSVDPIIHKSLPSHIFIKPLTKRNAEE